MNTTPIMCRGVLSICAAFRFSNTFLFKQSFCLLKPGGNSVTRFTEKAVFAFANMVM